MNRNYVLTAINCNLDFFFLENQIVLLHKNNLIVAYIKSGLDTESLLMLMSSVSFCLS